MTYREEIIGDCRLILGDCREVLPALERVDACLCDPPYGIDMAGGFSGAGGFSAPIQRREYEGTWDDQRPSAEVFKLILESAETHIIWGGNYFTDMLPVSRKWLFWDKCQTMPTFSDGELAWTSLSGVATKQFTYNGNGLHAKEKDREHPTQKPIQLMNWCLDFLPKAKSVLDPFMGSGSTGVACVKRGKSFIGIEREQSYFDIACRRIEEAYKQPDMFISAPEPKPVQVSMFEKEI